MAGVNLSEESACILATNSDAFGTLIRSCPEEQLLSADVLKMKILETGERNTSWEMLPSLGRLYHVLNVMHPFLQCIDITLY